MGVSRSEEKAGQFKVKVDFALILRISEMMAVMGDMMTWQVNNFLSWWLLYPVLRTCQDILILQLGDGMNFVHSWLTLKYGRNGLTGPWRSLTLIYHVRRFLTKIRNTEADRSLLPVENDRTPTYSSIVTTTPPNTLPGRDSVLQPEYSLTDTLGVAEASQVSTPNYSKHPYVSRSNSHLWKLC